MLSRFFKPSTLLLILLFMAAFGIRLYDLDDLPLNFHSTRQLFSMIRARGMYYAMSPELPAWQREIAMEQLDKSPVIEPPIVETITALSYRVFGENLALMRIYSSIFWLVGGFFLYLLAVKISGKAGALLALVFYLFLPYGIFASRTFQPDPLMVMCIIMAAWALWNWRETPTWRWAVTVGLLNGLAILVKNVAVFPLLGAALALVLERGLIASIKDRQTWAVAVLSVLPAGLYTAYGLWVAGFLGQQLSQRFFPENWFTLAFYLRWKGQWDAISGFGAVLLGVAGLFVARRRALAFLLGLWLGYLIYGMTFAYHIVTHDYYHLPFIPILGLSLAPVAEALFEKIATTRPGRLWKPIAGVLVTLVIVLQLWTARVELARDNYLSDVAYWEEIGDAVGHIPEPVICLCQDYGYRLAYWGWQPTVSWYNDGDLTVRALAGQDVDLKTRVADFVNDRPYFVITHFARLDDQPDLKALLYNTYPIHAQGKGYIIFDLQRPKP